VCCSSCRSGCAKRLTKSCIRLICQSMPCRASAQTVLPPLSLRRQNPWPSPRGESVCKPLIAGLTPPLYRAMSLVVSKSPKCGWESLYSAAWACPLLSLRLLTPATAALCLSLVVLMIGLCQGGFCWDIHGRRSLPREAMDSVCGACSADGLGNCVLRNALRPVVSAGAVVLIIAGILVITPKGMT
jgi:hypothetical protein